jgi:hypothetical protein
VCRSESSFWRDRNGQMGLTGVSAGDQHGITLLGNEMAAGEVAHKRLVDRRILEREDVDHLLTAVVGTGSLRRTRSMAAGSIQSLNGAPLRKVRACERAPARNAKGS